MKNRPTSNLDSAIKVASEDADNRSDNERLNASMAALERARERSQTSKNLHSEVPLVPPHATVEQQAIEAIYSFVDAIDEQPSVTYALAAESKRSGWVQAFNPDFVSALAATFDARSLEPNIEPSELDITNSPIVAAIWESIQALEDRDDLSFCVVWKIAGEDCPRLHYSSNLTYEDAWNLLAFALKDHIDQLVEFGG